MSSAFKIKSASSYANVGLDLGVEATSTALSNLDLLVECGIKHLQISLPGLVSPHEARKLGSQFELVLHSNLLNTFAFNDWCELEWFASTLRELKLIRVIEHASSFRDAQGLKGAITEGFEYSEGLKNLAVANIQRWQDLLGFPISIENAPFTENVEEYFELLVELRQATGCELVVDVPHLFISARAANFSQQTLEQIAKDLDPSHLHVGGISVLKGKLRDNHKSLSKDVVSLARKLFPDVNRITIEQDHSIPVTALPNFCDTVRSPLAEPSFDSFHSASTCSAAETNEELADLDWAPSVIRRHAMATSSITNPLFLYEKYCPFYFPLETLKANSQQLDAKEVLKVAVNILKKSHILGQWAHSYISSSSAKFGKLNETVFEKSFGDLLSSSTDTQKEAVKFWVNKEEWVSISSSDLQHFSQKGVQYERSRI